MSKDSRPSENFVVFGTAFPEPTEKDRRAGRSDAGQFVPVWKQEARDEKGRRRFHGAFTGGFSAGYFNTVGSKEGWEPSNYVSSRSARNERKEAKPEDFMDEEDLEAMAGSKKLVATEEFDILGGTERELAARRTLESETGDGGLLASSLMGMFGPPKDSIGIRLLRKMGWRPGQGIGPRLKRSLDDDDDDESEDENSDITFAPHDTPIENFSAKRDTYGLGYDLATLVPQVAEMKRLREIARQEGMNGTAVDRKNRSSFGVGGGSGSGAFGLGAFDENDGEEDDDIYGESQAALKNYHHALYDDNESGFTQDELKAQRLKSQRQTKYTPQEDKVKCSDGRPPIKGFIVSKKNEQIGQWHAPPKVPSDFTGQHIIKDNNTPKPATITKDSIFSFEERGNVLGEKPIEARSVFDYMPKHSKDQLDRAVSFFIDIGKDKSQLSEFPTVTKDVAKLALQGFIPFGDNPKKQARYKDYLENCAGHLTEDGVPKKVLPIPEGLTYEAGMKELDEFAKAARIFRPISAMMSGRFTSSTESKNVEVVSFEGGLKTEEQYRKEKEAISKSQPEPEKKQLTQEQEAAAMKMFGNLTRTVKPFYPTRLVCKRFNVRNPHPDHDPTAPADVGRSQAGSKDVLSKESMDSMLNKRLPLKFTSSNTTTTTTIEEEKQQQQSDDPALNSVIPKPSDRVPDEPPAPTTGVETKQVNEEEEEEEGGPALDYERPSMDIFKAIFDDSESDDDEEEEEEEEEEQEKERSVKKSTVTTIVKDEDDFIGPPAPPKSNTIDIPIERPIQSTENSSEPFRPMFKRASERKESVLPLTNVVSEEIVVQPFKPRSSGHKRRHVSVSDDDNDGEKSESESEREEKKKRSKHHKSSSRHHKSSKRSKSRERRHHKSSREDKEYKSSRDDRSREHKSSRDDRSREHKRNRDEEKRHRSRDEEKRHHKSSRKRSKSPEKSRKRNRSDHRSSSHRTEEIDDYEGMWVEKEPVIPLDNSNNKKDKGRKTAVDLW